MLNLKNCFCLLATVTLASGTYACKPTATPQAATSKVAGADEILNANKSVTGQPHLCGPSGVATAGAADVAAAALAQVKAAIPTGLLAQVDVQTDTIASVNATCLKFAKQSGLSACFVFDPASGAQKPTVYVADDAAAIHNYLIATMAEAYDFFYATQVGDASAKFSADKIAALSPSDQSLMQGISLARSLRQALTNDVIADLTAAKQGAKVEALYSKIATDGKKADSPLLQRFIFEEIADAVYCSKDSYTQLATTGFTAKTLADVDQMKLIFGSPWYSAKAAAR